MTLTDGRGELYQWDTGRTLTVDDATVTQVHFQNRAYGRTIDVDVKDGTAIIPDELLQKPGDLRVYAFSGTAESGFTKVERVFNIVRRNKPNDYMYTPTEQKSLEGLQKQIGDLSDLKTDAKTDIVAAINETATAGQTLGLTGATVGQVPVVKTVDASGVPTEWGAGDLPSLDEEWVQLVDQTVEEAVQNLTNTWVSTPMKKIRILLETLAASSNTNYMPFTVSTGDNSTFNCARFYPTAMPVTEARCTEYFAEMFKVGEYNAMRLTEYIGGIKGVSSSLGNGIFTLKPEKSAVSTGGDGYNNPLLDQITGLTIHTYATFEAGTRLRIWGVPKA